MNCSVMKKSRSACGTWSVTRVLHLQRINHFYPDHRISSGYRRRPEDQGKNGCPNLNKQLLSMSMTDLLPIGNEGLRQNTGKSPMLPLSFRFTGSLYPLGNRLVLSKPQGRVVRHRCPCETGYNAGRLCRLQPLNRAFGQAVYFTAAVDQAATFSHPYFRERRCEASARRAGRRRTGTSQARGCALASDRPIVFSL
jgi:hypothetical protein